MRADTLEVPVEFRIADKLGEVSAEPIKPDAMAARKGVHRKGEEEEKDGYGNWAAGGVKK